MTPPPLPRAEEPSSGEASRTLPSLAPEAACPSDHALSGFLDDGLSEAARDALSAHIDGCPACQDRLDRLTHDTDGAVARYKDLSQVLATGFTERLDRHGEATPPTPVAPHRPGSALPTVPGFDVLEEIGHGGMGVVYRARHRRLNRLVALKMVLAGTHADPRAVQRFFFEAEVMARVRHPQVVEVYEANVAHGADGTPVPYLAMELLEGGTLRAVLKAGRLEPRHAAALIEGIARAVHAAHLQGIVHRDLKPGNILLNAECGIRNAEFPEKPGAGPPPPSIPHSTHSAFLKVCDFGLAKLIAPADADLTETGHIVGTPSYMAPEQASGDVPAGPETDVYALGTILFEMLAGQPPFHGGEAAKVLARVMRDPPPAVNRLRPDVPRDLAAVTMKCLEKRPEHRYRSAEALADDLRRFLEGRPTVARPAAALERGWRWTRRNPSVAGLLACLATVLLVGVSAVVALWQRAERTAGEERRAREAAVVAQAAATDALHVAGSRQARLEFDRGVALCEDGQVEAGLSHLWRSLEIADSAGATDLARVARVHLAAWPGKLSQRLRTITPGGRPQALAFTRDGSKLATAGGTLQLWNADTGTLIRTFHARDPAANFRTVALSHDGQRLAAGDDAGRLWFANITTETLDALAPGDTPITALVFAPDGTLWAANGTHGARRWNLDTAEIVGEAASRTLRSPVQALALTADGSRLFLGDTSGFVFDWDTTEARVRGGWASVDPVVDLCLGGDDALLAATGSTGRCRLIDRKTNRTDHDVNLLGARGVAAAYSPDGRRVLIGDGDGTVRILERATAQPVGVPMRFAGELHALRLRPGTDTFAVCAGDAVTLCRPAAAGWQTLATPEGRIASVAFDAAGVRVAVASGRQVALYDPARGSLRNTYALPDEPLSVSFDPYRPRLICGARAGWLSVPFDNVPQMVPGSAAGAPYSWARACGKERIATASHTRLRLWNAESFREEPPPAGNAELRPLDVRAGGEELLAAAGTALRLLHPDTLQPSRPTAGTLPDEATAGACSPDGSRVLIGLRNGSAVWRDVASGKDVVPSLTHGRAVTAVAVSPDGATLLTGSRDGTARFWDAATGLPLGPTLRHAGPVTTLAFSPAGDGIVTGTANGHALIWPTPPAPLAGMPRNAEFGTRNSD